MIETVNMSSTETFLEVGCGTGVVSVSLSKRAKSGIGVDINDLAIENSKFNAQRHNVKNVQFFKSNVFENISGKFDVIICNPPYTKHDIFDNIDRMYWDPDDEMKRKFFKDVNNYLKKNGRIYFGWANFGDIDVDLPLKLAKENGCVLEKITEKNHANKFSFLVLEFKGSGI
jgi:release factor glutamine methyltransferase